MVYDNGGKADLYLARVIGNYPKRKLGVTTYFLEIGKHYNNNLKSAKIQSNIWHFFPN